MASASATIATLEPRKRPLWRTFQATLTVAAVLIAFALVFFSRHVLFCLFTGIVIATAVRSFVARLRRRGYSLNSAAAIVYSTLVAVLCGILAMPVPIISAQVARLRAALPGMYSSAREQLIASLDAPLRRVVERLPASLDDVLASGGAMSEVAAAAAGWIDAGAVIGGLFAVVGVMILAFYWTLHEERTVRSVLLWVPARKRDATREFIDAVLTKTGAFVRGQALLCLIVGGLSLIAFWIIGLPYPIALALLAGVFEAVPIFGPLLGAGPALLVASTLGVEPMLWTAAAAFIIQQLENHLLLPRVMSRSVGVNSLVTLLAMAAFGTLFGFAGLLLAIPLAALLQLLLDRFLLGHEALQAELPAGRDRISRLRLEAAELAHDARQRFRRNTDTADLSAAPTDGRPWEETIEALAVDLERALADGSPSGERGESRRVVALATIEKAPAAASVDVAESPADPLADRPLVRIALHATIVVATLAGVALLWPLRGVLLLFALAIAAAAIVAPVVERLRRRGWPQSAALTAAYLPPLLLLVGIVAAGARPLSSEFRRLTDAVIAASQSWQGSAVDGSAIFQALVADDDAVVKGQAGSPEMQLTQEVFGMTAGLMGLLVQAGVVLVISIYWLVDRDYFERLWLSVVSARRRTAVREAWQDVELEVGAYFRSETLQMFAAALLLAVGFRVLGFPYPLIAAACGGALWLLPWVGVLLAVAAVVSLPLALLPTVGLTNYLWMVVPSAVYAVVVLGWLEFVVEPRLFARRRYNTLLMAVVTLALGEAMGILGLLLGPPLALSIEILVAHALRLSVNAATAQAEPFEAVSARAEGILAELAGTPMSQELAGLAERLGAIVREAQGKC